MSDTTYEPVIGLEVHCELSTATKLFCGCPNEFGAEPNTHICPVCLGLPGSLPVLNERAVEFALRFAEAVHLLSTLVQSGRRIVGFDLVEVAPGDDEWDANVGARLLYKLCGAAVHSQVQAASGRGR